MRSLLIAIMMFISFPVLAQTSDDAVIGTIVEVEGSATLTPPGTTAAAGTQLHLNDVVVTGPSSRVFILFIDNTEMTLSENTEVKLDSYTYDPDNATGNGARYSILKGAFQYVSGLIGKSKDPDVVIETLFGSIGIRGTDFWAGEIDGEFGVSVNEGHVALKTDAGEEPVTAGQGTFVKNRFSAPSRARAWKPEKLQRVAAMVQLKRRDWVRQQVNQMQPRQQQMRQQYQNFMQQKREGLAPLKQQMQEKRQEMQDNRQQMDNRQMPQQQQGAETRPQQQPQGGETQPRQPQPQQQQKRQMMPPQKMQQMQKKQQQPQNRSPAGIRRQ